MTNPPKFINGPGGQLAYHHRIGEGPGVFWLGGFKSDMLGTKASFLDQWASNVNRAYTRFDYSGHGQSEGAFEDGTISAWAEDALMIFDTVAKGPQILVGSSMGGWIATLLALRRPETIAGVVFIAPAPDFTESLMWEHLTTDEKETVMREGCLEQPSDYDEPYVITKKLIEDGRNNLVLNAPIAITAPVRILQGMADPDVPWRHAMKLAERLVSEDVKITLTRKGDHSLSTPDDLKRLVGAIENLFKS